MKKRVQIWIDREDFEELDRLFDQVWNQVDLGSKLTSPQYRSVGRLADAFETARTNPSNQEDDDA